MTGRPKNQAGFALILTLVVTALMVAVVVEMIHQVYVDTSLSRGFRNGQQASILAESGASGGAQLLSFGLKDRTFTALTDRWATPLKLEDDAGSLEISIAEESGKININSLVQPNGEYQQFTLGALNRLAGRLKLPGDLWGGVADWLDTDDLPRSGGAETPYYRALKPPYSTRNGKLMSLTELSLVKGISSTTLTALRPHLTIFSDLPGSPVSTININTASRDVLAVLDERIDERMADRIMEERRLQPFKSTAELSRVPGLDTIAIGLVGKVSVKGNIFRITSVARVKESTRTVEAVVRIGGTVPEYLSWQEY